MNDKSENKSISNIDILAAYQIFGGLSGLGLVVYLVTTINNYNAVIIAMLMIAIMLYCYSVYCGVMLFRKIIFGLKLSRINQLLQIVHFYISGFAFQYISGLHLSVTLDLVNLSNFKFTFGTSTWLIAFNETSEIASISINLLAIFIVIFIDRQISKYKNMATASLISEIGLPG